MAILAMKTYLLLLLSASIASVNSAAVQRRAVINHDAVVGFPQTVPGTDAGASALKYKPFLEVRHGCVPFPAVDALGNTGYVLNRFLTCAIL